jgi:hypothetical protein
MTGTRSFTLATKSSRTVMVLVQDLSGRAVLPLVPESGERELIAVGTREVVGLLAFWHLLPFAIRTTIFSCTLVAPCETFATCARALSPRQRFLSYFSSKLSRLTPPTIDVLVPIDVVGGFSETRFATRLRSSPVGGRHDDIMATKTPELPWLSYLRRRAAVRLWRVKFFAGYVLAVACHRSAASAPLNFTVKEFDHHPWVTRVTLEFWPFTPTSEDQFPIDAPVVLSVWRKDKRALVMAGHFFCRCWYVRQLQGSSGIAVPRDLDWTICFVAACQRLARAQRCNQVRLARASKLAS